MQERPVLIFDGRCGFCTLSVDWAAARLREPFEAVPWQRADLTRFGLTEEAAQRRVYWVELDGRRLGGHRAVARVLRGCGGAWRVLGELMRLPPLSWIAAMGYFVVARYRRHLPGTTPACKRGPDPC